MINIKIPISILLVLPLFFAVSVPKHAHALEMPNPNNSSNHFTSPMPTITQPIPNVINNNTNTEVAFTPAETPTPTPNPPSEPKSTNQNNTVYKEPLKTEAVAQSESPKPIQKQITDAASSAFTLPKAFALGTQDYNYPDKPLSPTAAKKLYELSGGIALLGGLLLFSKPKKLKQVKSDQALKMNLNPLRQNNFGSDRN